MLVYEMVRNVATPDPAQGESGGGKPSLSSKLKAKVPHPRVKDKVKNLKNRLPGMKKHNVEDEAHEDSSEYDENSPRVSYLAYHSSHNPCSIEPRTFKLSLPFCRWNLDFVSVFQS